jgi:hypothetical protein
MQIELRPAHVTVEAPEPATLQQLHHVELTADGVIELHAEPEAGEPRMLHAISHPSGGRFSAVEAEQVAECYGVKPQWPMSENQRLAAKGDQEAARRVYTHDDPAWMLHWRSLSGEQQTALQADMDERRALVGRIMPTDRHTGIWMESVESFRRQRGLPRPYDLVPQDEQPSIEEQAQRTYLGNNAQHLLAIVALEGGVEQPSDDERSLQEFGQQAQTLQRLALMELVEPPANPNDVRLTELGRLLAPRAIEVWYPTRAAN